MSHGFDNGSDPAIHEREHYTSELAADILLDLPRVGTFALGGTERLPDLPPAAVAEVLAAAVSNCPSAATRPCGSHWPNGTAASRCCCRRWRSCGAAPRRPCTTGHGPRRW
jgi:hypothetical protein